MAPTKVVLGVSIVVVALVVSTFSTPVFDDSADDLLQRLELGDVLTRDGVNFKRNHRMGWRKCNPLFNFRCGKKTVFSYAG